MKQVFVEDGKIKIRLFGYLIEKPVVYVTIY